MTIEETLDLDYEDTMTPPIAGITYMLMPDSEAGSYLVLSASGDRVLIQSPMVKMLSYEEYDQISHSPEYRELSFFSFAIHEEKSSLEMGCHYLK